MHTRRCRRIWLMLKSNAHLGLTRKQKQAERIRQLTTYLIRMKLSLKIALENAQKGTTSASPTKNVVSFMFKPNLNECAIIVLEYLCHHMYYVLVHSKRGVVSTRNRRTCIDVKHFGVSLLIGTCECKSTKPTWYCRECSTGYESYMANCKLSEQVSSCFAVQQLWNFIAHEC